MAPFFRGIAVLAFVATPAVFAAAAAPKSDLVPKEKRDVAIATGKLLSHPGELPPVAADLVSPFSPPDFNQPDPEAAPPKAGAAAATAAVSSTSGSKMSSARDVLETMALLIPSKGTIQKPDGEFLLTIEGGRTFKVGDILNISQGDGPKYPLEITRISNTDFTLRYQGEVKTRAIVIKSSSK